MFENDLIRLISAQLFLYITYSFMGTIDKKVLKYGYSDIGSSMKTNSFTKNVHLSFSTSNFQKVGNSKM